MVRTDRHQLRAAAGDSDLAEAIKLLARAHQTLIWDRHRHLLRLRAALVEFFPAALAAFPDLAAADALELLQAAPEPTSAARLSRPRVAAALTRASRRGVQAKAAQIQQALRAEQLPQPETVVAAYAATVRAAVAVIGTLNAQIAALAGQVEAHFGEHPDAELYRSQPGLGGVLGARVLGEFGDDPGRYRDARARRNYAGSSPVTKQSGKKKVVVARFVRLLRSAPRPRHRPPRRAAPAVQPAGRHPSRLPQDPHSLQRSNRVVAPHLRRCHRSRLTPKRHGMS
jgi:Transposase IS116/IS110/IS902 family